MTIDDEIRDEKLQYFIKREAAKISALLLGKINKYEFLTGEEILFSNQKQIIEQAKFTYSALGKAIQNQGQIKTIESNKGVANESHKIFDELSHERMSKIKDSSRQVDLNNLTCYFKNKSISPINVIGFKAPLHLYGDIFDGNIELAKAEEDQNQLKFNLNEIKKGNPKKTSEDQIKTIENITNHTE